MENKECPRCPLGFGDWQAGEYFDRCNNCGYEVDKRTPLYAPSPFINKSYEMKELHREGGYVYSFYDYEPLERNDNPHIHVKGHGREIEYYLSFPIRIKEKKPKNFPEGEESKIRQVVRKRREEFLAAWEEVKRRGGM